MPGFELIDNAELKAVNSIFKNGGVLFNNLKYISASEVIYGSLFDDIIKSWKTKPMERCWNTCKQAKQDIFIHEEIT